METQDELLEYALSQQVAITLTKRLGPLGLCGRYVSTHGACLRGFEIILYKSPSWLDRIFRRSRGNDKVKFRIEVRNQRIFYGYGFLSQQSKSIDFLPPAYLLDRLIIDPAGVDDLVDWLVIKQHDL